MPEITVLPFMIGTEMAYGVYVDEQRVSFNYVEEEARKTAAWYGEFLSPNFEKWNQVTDSGYY